MYQTGKNSWWKHWDFMFLDLICFQLAYIAAFIIRHGLILPYKWEEYRDMGIMIVLVEFCAGFFLENYKDIIKRGYFEELKKTILQITVTIIIVFTCLFLAKASEVFSRAVFLQTWLLAIVFTYVIRCLWKIYIRKRIVAGANLQKLVIVSTSDKAKKIMEEMNQNEYKDYSVEGLILLDSPLVGNVSGVPVIADGENAAEVLQNGVVDQVFIDGEEKDPRIAQILRACSEMGITTHYNLGISFRPSGNTIVENFSGYIVMTSSIKFADTRQIFAKRIMDILGGIIGIILTIVLTIIFGPIIYIQSPGPIFFSQERVGKNGRRFRIYKFRSMYPDAEARKKELMKKNKMQGFMFKMDNDPRIIPIGKFMRKMSLDEFPQFFNILRGDMSLVGTRPPTVDEYMQYELHHKVRLAAKPGLTGLWQVSGRNDIVDFEEVVALDKKYIEEWNIGMDLRIICQTVKVVITGKGSI